MHGALKRGFLAKKGHLKRLRPPATACDRLRLWAPPIKLLLEYPEYQKTPIPLPQHDIGIIYTTMFKNTE